MIPQPSISEQQKIVDILGNFENILDIEYQNIKLLKHLKKGLMQVLLTGKVRVKVDS